MTVQGSAGAPGGGVDDRLVEEIARAVLARILDGARDPVILAGGIAAGKTTTARALAQRLREQGVTVGGVLAPRRTEEAGATVGYGLVDLQTGEERDFAAAAPPGHPVGRFFVRREALQFAQDAVRRAAEVCDVVFLDEIGGWELAGGGHADSVRRLVGSRALPILLVRDALVSAVIDAFGLQAATVFYVGERPSGKPADPVAAAFWSIVDTIEFPLLVTVDGDGFPQSRPMQLIERQGPVLWFPTSRGSKKVRQIEVHPQATVLFVDTDRFNYASFCGIARIVADPERNARLWREDWRDDWPLGALDPNFVFVRVEGIRGYYVHGPTGEAGEIDLRA